MKPLTAVYWSFSFVLLAGCAAHPLQEDVHGAKMTENKISIAVALATLMGVCLAGTPSYAWGDEGQRDRLSYRISGTDTDREAMG